MIKLNIAKMYCVVNTGTEVLTVYRHLYIKHTWTFLDCGVIDQWRVGVVNPQWCLSLIKNKKLMLIEIDETSRPKLDRTLLEYLTL